MPIPLLFQRQIMTSSEDLVDVPEICWLGVHGLLDDILVTLNVVAQGVALLEATSKGTIRVIIVMFGTALIIKRTSLHACFSQGFT